MQLPDIPHKKSMAYVALIALLLSFTYHSFGMPDWIAYSGFALLTLTLAYALYWSIRQRCYGYVAIIVAALCIFVGSVYLVLTWTPDKAGYLINSQQASSIIIGLEMACSLLLAILAIGFSTCWIRNRHDKDKINKWRTRFRIAFFVLALIMLLLSLIAIPLTHVMKLFKPVIVINSAI